MMQQLSKYKGIFILALALVGGYFIYTNFFGPGAAVTPSLQGSVATEIEQELLAELLELQRIRLDETIFGDPALRVLVDFSQEIEPQPVGRNNPFAPYPGSGGESSQGSIFVGGGI